MRNPEDECKRCRGTGIVYERSQLNPSDCKWCNGTGLASKPIWIVATMIGYVLTVMLFAHIIFKAI